MKKELIIDRSKWRTGGDGNYATGKGVTSLLNGDGAMCCLGFDMIRCGLKRKDIFEWGNPSGLPSKILDKNRDSIQHLLTGYNGDSRFTNRAISINDSENRKPKIREKLLINHFKKIGVKVKFTGKYTKP